MKKILLLTIPVILLTGCRSTLDETNDYLQDETTYRIETDKETCVEYIVGVYRFSVRLNADGTPMLNEKCLERFNK